MSEIAKHWIDGEWVGSGTVSESVNPAAISEFTEAKTVVNAIPPFQG